MNIKSLFATAALLALPFAAQAADLPVPMKESITPAPAPSWTGFYLGGTVGIGSYTSDMHDGDDDLTEGNLTGKATSFNAGVTAGYNWQFRSFVLGVEGDWSWTNASTGNVIGYEGAEYMNANLNWFATARARAGVTFDNVLVYVTGGAAWMQANHTAIDTTCSASDSACGVNQTQTGFAVGAGVEAKLWQNWSAKVEYLYLDMPSINVLTTGNEGFTWNDSAQIVRAGLNYHF